jgi:hypothetical protein
MFRCHHGFGAIRLLFKKNLKSSTLEQITSIILSFCFFKEIEEVHYPNQLHGWNVVAV